MNEVATTAFLLGVVVGVAAALVLVGLARVRDRRVRERPPAGATNLAPPRRDPGSGLGELGTVGDLAEIGVVRLTPDLRVRDANRHAHVLLGRRPGTLAGLSAIEAFADQRGEEAVQRAAATGEASVELAPRPATRSTVLARARALDGTVWVVLEDVSELRRLQRIRTEFIDNLSHELRTPLTNVRLLTETLTLEMEPLQLPEPVRESIRKIDVETAHLVQMVTELLDLSRIEQGTGRRRTEDVDLAAVVHGAVDRIRLFAERSGVSIDVEIPASLTHVLGDADRLGQMLLNVLHNAVKFSPPGARVTVAARTSDGQVLVAVRDEGAGIPEADLERVFERFYKVDKARVRGRGGTGLGLAIARHIVESHDGRIWAESSEGAGSTFTIALPAVRASPRC